MIKRKFQVSEPAYFGGAGNCVGGSVVIRMTAFVGMRQDNRGPQTVDEFKHLAQQKRKVQIGFFVGNFEVRARSLRNSDLFECSGQFVSSCPRVLQPGRETLLPRNLHVPRAAIRNVQDVHRATRMAIQPDSAPSTSSSG